MRRSSVIHFDYTASGHQAVLYVVEVHATADAITFLRGIPVAVPIRPDLGGKATYHGWRLFLVEPHASIYLPQYLAAQRRARAIASYRRVARDERVEQFVPAPFDAAAPLFLKRLQDRLARERRQQRQAAA